MVIIGLVEKKNDPEDQEMERPDWDPDHLGDDDWQLGTYEETAIRLKDDLKVKPVHPADVVSIGTKNHAIPLKDVDDDLLLGFTGRYCGHNELIPALKNDAFVFKLKDRMITTSRWTMAEVREELRSEDTCEENDQMAQFF